MARTSFRHAWLVGFALLLAAATSPASHAAPAGAVARTVCVDAGHGGGDPGAVYGGMQEKDLTLDIATRLKLLLEGANFDVVMTRTGDTALDNTPRAEICNAGGATTVVAIHLNAAANPNTNYFKAFWGKRNKDEAFCKQLNVSYKLKTPDGSALLQHQAVGQFASGLLLKASAPACLVETVFLSNPAEQDALKNGARQQAIAQELFNGLVAWYSAR